MKQPRHEKVLQDCREEISKKHNYQIKDGIISFYESSIVYSEVLPLYAKRIAIEFDKWKFDNGYSNRWLNNEGKLMQCKGGNHVGRTTEQLLNNFLNEPID